MACLTRRRDRLTRRSDRPLGNDGLSHKLYEDFGYPDELVFYAWMAYWVAQGASEAFEADLHDVAVLEFDAFAEAEGVGAEEVDVHVSGASMAFELEVVMLHVLDAVRHDALSRANVFRPEYGARALDGDFAWDRIKSFADHQFGTDGALAQLGRREVEVIFPFEFVVGKLVAYSEADAPGTSR